MREKAKTVAREVAVLAVIAGLIVPGIGYMGLAETDVSHAAPIYKDDDDKEKKSEDETDAGRSARDDRQVSGQVLEINSLKDPPEMSIANTDGVVKVRMLTKDLIPRNAVRLGDHVTLIGEKISEVEFDCQDMSVDGHLGDDPDEEDDD